ncbi:PPE domain-containing protein [Saccharopolyspora rhizosphaerae]|uniref:PPE domain-containing protein n=1 Tax=Saccharopolyspora rhizosphaerae TaxID=2492662 RepID=A0A3R8QWZ5_9PSEU|nr:PPE domain-containing protein [Saccharopolyspora rhizosphaerae]RRO12775.1 PPE domain-containing protein [Saccharopolyspora rhizosphaerae]
MGDHRWQGYRHAELHAQINEGPGAHASTDSVRRWSELTRALGEIDGGLAAATAAARSGWRGEAADSAHAGVRPLGEWAVLAQQASEVMRERAEQQAEHISKARRDMPPPVQVTSEDPGTAVAALAHLFGGQTDYEVQEARQHAAEQRAFDVMRNYEAATQATTTSLASFAPPPQVVVDAPASGASGTAGGSPKVTISWGPAVAPGPVVGGSSSNRGRTARGAGPATRSAAARSSGKRATGRRDEAVDHQVTEKVGDGGFFGAPQTGSRPVIGGEPGS